MKKFMLLTIGFEQPTPEIMDSWNTWFKSISDKIVDQGGLYNGGREISADGVKDLPLGLDSITGYVIINAESLEEVEKIAQSNPFITSIQFYEIMGK